MLVVNEENWGPKPTQLLKCWADISRYKLFVCDQWRSYQVEGWRLYFEIKAETYQN